MKQFQQKASQARLETATNVNSQINAEPFAQLGEMADSSINITVRAWTLSEQYWDVFFEMNKRFYIELPQRGFEFPFPQMDVHLNQVSQVSKS